MKRCLRNVTSGDIIVPDMNRVLLFFILVGVLFYELFSFRAPIASGFQQLESKLFPGLRPITYGIGDFDQRFGITQEELIKSLEDAAWIWEEPVSKKLFEYRPDGDLKINLVYDERQAATVKQQDLAERAENDRISLQFKKDAHERTLQIYEGRKEGYNKALSEYEAGVKDYNSKVSYWNSRGGAPKDEAELIMSEKARLDADLAVISGMKSELDRMVAEINASASALNSKVDTINSAVEEHNAVGRSMGEEFREAEFISDKEGRRINVYQFADRTKLTRVLAHELGHALGLEHVEDQQGIMHRLNNGVNEYLTDDDLMQLRKRLRVK